MNYRTFGNTKLEVSEIGFGTWGIGGPAMAGDIPLGWGDVNDDISIKALRKADELGINFYDTADFYGLGHSEELLGKIFGNREDIVIASKVGHRLDSNNSIYTDYSGEHIINACECSLKRLQRDTIDFYQLHTSKIPDFSNGESIKALEKLKEQGKIRYWGVSLNTYKPEPEANFLFDSNLGDGLQVVLNIINQKSLDIINRAGEQGLGIIARMPLQFGLLTGKFDEDSTFDKDDHRHFRLTPEILESSLNALKEVWPLTEKYNVTKTELSLSFILSFDAVSTVIPGIKTPEQAEKNTRGIIELEEQDREYITSLYEQKFSSVLEKMRQNDL